MHILIVLLFAIAIGLLVANLISLSQVRVRVIERQPMNEHHEHGHHEHEHEHHEREEIRLLRQQVRQGAEEIRLLKEILSHLPATRVLSSIKISFGGAMPVGPVTIAVGQTVTASVVGFDQNGAPFTGPIPAAAFAVDNAAIATVDPTSGATVGVAAGVANVTASLTSAEGLALTDTETVTVTGVVPVLSSIKISFD